MTAQEVIIDMVYGEKSLKVVTFNIRCKYTGDGINSFVYRAGIIADKINKEKPDVISFQEMTSAILDKLKILLPEYEFVGHGRNENYGGEGLYTAVRKDTCSILGWDTIWLSPEPYTPGSRFENQSKYPRICVQTMVRHKETGKITRVFNVHLDTISEEIRIEGLNATFDFIESYKEKGNHPFILLGDFNARPDSETINICNQKSGMQEVTKNVTETYQSFGKKSSKIDYIYMSDELAEALHSVEAWTDESDGIYLSDHYPVCAELWLK